MANSMVHNSFIFDIKLVGRCKKDFLHKFYIKYEAIMNHCVGHSPMKHIDVDELFNKRVIICELESSLNDDDTIDASVVSERETEAYIIS